MVARVGEGRLVIYNADDLTIHKRISAPSIWSPTVRTNGDLFWQNGGALNGETLETYQSPVEGVPLTDNQASVIWYCRLSRDWKYVVECR